MEIKYRTEFGKLLEHFGLSGHAAEVGVAEGRNSQVLIKQPAITKLYMIDAWTKLEQKGDGGSSQSWHDGNYKEAHERTEQFKSKRIVLKGLSGEMISQIPDDSLVFAYIDGDHSYKGCYSDLFSIWPKIKRGGVLAGHDYLNMNYGVNKAVKDFVLNHCIQERILGFTIHTTEEDGDKNMVSFWFVKD